MRKKLRFMRCVVGNVVVRGNLSYSSGHVEKGEIKREKYTKREMQDLKGS